MFLADRGRHVGGVVKRVRVSSWLLVACAGALGCPRAPARDPGPGVQVVGESSRIRLEDPLPARSPWFDGARVRLAAARGETLGIQVLQRARAPVTLTFDAPAIATRGFAVESFPVRRPSTAMYGGSQGAGTYADALTPATAPATNPAFFEIAIGRDAAPGTRAGVLTVGARRIPVELAIAPVTLPELAPRVWAYGDPRELAWAAGAGGDPPRAEATPAERACIATFNARGVLLSPDVHLGWWPARKALLAGVRDLPVVIPTDPGEAGDAVRRWIEATRGTGQVPFSIPIDEPRTPALRAKVVALAAAVRAAGGGPTTFRYAVTDVPRPEYGDLIDLHITLAPKLADAGRQWTYNGAPPRAGSMVLDAHTPGTRTWGWIGWRWQIPRWYVWDALYWHDRHNRDGAPLPGRALSPAVDPVSFDDGEDHGNFDGVLALPGPGGCRPTLRLAALHRGQQDRALLELAAACAPEATAALAADLVPRALGDAPATGKPSWPTDEAAWEQARRRLLELASCE